MNHRVESAVRPYDIGHIQASANRARGPTVKQIKRVDMGQIGRADEFRESTTERPGSEPTGRESEREDP